MAVTANAAAEGLKGKARWNYPPLSPTMKRMAGEKPIYVYNVGDQRWSRGMGSLGEWLIRACEPGQEVSEPTVVPQILMETVPVDIQKMEWRENEGMEFAIDLVGYGPFKAPSQDLRQWGVFISMHNPPKKEEIAAAKETLLQTYSRLIADGDNFYNEGSTEYKNITSQHRKALRAMNQTRPWGVESIKLDNCPACGKSMPPDIAVHDCGAVINWDKALEFGRVTQQAYDEHKQRKANKKSA